VFLNPAGAGLILATLLALVVVPFLPGLRELLWPRDNGRLELDEAYGRDPQYFARRFRVRFAGFFAGQNFAGATAAPKSSERVRLASSLHVRSGITAPRTTLASISIEAGSTVRLGECYARHSISLGASSHATSLLTDGTLRLDRGCTIADWAVSAADMWAEIECDLGRSATCGGTLRLARGVRFRRLFGNPITTYATAHALAHTNSPHRFGETGDVVVTGDYEVAARSTVHGSIRAKRVLVAAGACIFGNVLATGDVTLEGSAALHGHIFSAGVVTLGPGSQIGTALHNKTVHGNRVIVAAGVSVHGSIVTNRGGTVV
jgi:hypothetical protein